MAWLGKKGMRLVDWERVPGDPGEQERLVKAMRAGKLLIYPTDTVYGVGCNALRAAAVKRLREATKKPQPLSVIAPSRAWVHLHCAVNFPDWLDKLPGPYTLIFEKKRPLLEAVSPGSTLGVRIPAHPFSALVAEAGVPFVTTSANIHGSPVPRKLAEMDYDLTEAVDVVLEAGTLSAKASTVVDLTGAEPRVVRG